MNLKLELLKSLTLPDFPSGSSINFYDGRLYLIGDDASHILVLDENYHKVDTIHLFDSPTKRIPKPEKADFETSTLLAIDGEDYLAVLGSASGKNRTNLILIHLKNEWNFESFNYREFIRRLKKQIDEVNIEGSTLIRNQFVLSNRGNTENPKNYIINTERDFWQRQREVGIAISELEVSIDSATFVGVSELCYVESHDLLLLTLSSELTDSAYEDGAIGNSYIGWIDSISQKMNQPHLQVAGITNLSEVAAEFKGEKIEGLCVEPNSSNEFTVHMISDDDQGQSKLFKLKIKID